MVVFPNAKINIGLNIVNKREDGYHNLESLFYPIAWTDALEIVKAPKFHFESYGLHIPGDSTQNLVVKAWKLLQQTYQLTPVHIILQKAIPIGAGLGGGSADAAFVIKAINDLFELGLNDEVMKKFAVQLGADCPFFIENQPKLVTGIGEIFEPVNVNLTNYQIIAVFPRKAINTAWAFSQLKLGGKPKSSVRSIIEQPIFTWKGQLQNDFEVEVIKVMPEIKAIKESFYNEGAVYASMSGSGSTLYGIFEKDVDIEKIKAKVSDSGYLTFTSEMDF